MDFKLKILNYPNRFIVDIRFTIVINSVLVIRQVIDYFDDNQFNKGCHYNQNASTEPTVIRCTVGNSCRRLVVDIHDVYGVQIILDNIRVGNVFETSTM